MLRLRGAAPGDSSCQQTSVEIHPLVIEDILHGRQTYSSKADYYNKHLFVRMLCHTLKDDDDTSPNIKVPNAPLQEGGRTGNTDPKPPPTYSAGCEEATIAPEEDLYARNGPTRGLFKRRTAVPTGHSSRIRTLAATSLSGAQPWIELAPMSDPEKVWARGVYPDLGGGGGSARSTARKYSMQLASMFETNVSTLS